MARRMPLRRWMRRSAGRGREGLREQLRLIDERAAAARKGLVERCNICGNSEFGLGPGKRTSVLGHPPRCLRCQSLERHRLLRSVWNLFPRKLLRQRSALQFSPDRSVAPEWFASYEVSVFGGDNHLDLQQIDRPDRSYGLVICNHVLEHVADDARAFHELMRILDDDGFLELTVPDPGRKQTTEDWGYPREELHGHYRHYGMDLVVKFSALDPSYRVVVADALDPVTGTGSPVFFWAKQPSTEARLTRILQPMRGLRGLPVRAASAGLSAARRLARLPIVPKRRGRGR